MKQFLFALLCVISTNIVFSGSVTAESLFKEADSLNENGKLLIDNSFNNQPALFFSQAEFDKYSEVIVVGSPLEIFLMSDISVNKPIHIVNVILNGNAPTRGITSKACLTIYGSHLNHENSVFKNISLKNSGSNTSF